MTKEDILQCMYNAMKDSWDWILDSDKPNEGLNYLNGVYDMTNVLLNKYKEGESNEQN